METQVTVGTVILVAAIYFGFKATKPLMKVASWIVVGLLVAATGIGATAKHMLGEAGKGGASFVDNVKDLGGR